MNQEDVQRPSMEGLLRRLAECPPEFLATCLNANGGKQVAAIIADHFRIRTGEPLSRSQRDWLKSLSLPTRSKQLERYWGLLSICVWLMHDDWFLDRAQFAGMGWSWLSGPTIRPLSDLIHPAQFLSDPDRREELTRLCLLAHAVIPRGETPEQFHDRLNTLDSLERRRVLQATAAAERRARAVREAMARAKAMESASRYGE